MTPFPSGDGRPESVLLLVNSGAGGPASRRRARGAVERLRSEPGVEVRDARQPGDFLRAVASVDRGTLPVAVGGDGTINMLVSAVLETRGSGSRVGVIPAGTANLLAAHLGIGHVDAALGALMRGESRPVDVMRIDRSDIRVAVVSVSAGFEGRFIEGFGGTRTLGRAAAGLRGLARGLTRRDAVRLEVDGEPLTSGGAVFAAGLYNTPLYAGGVVMVPGASADDGRVDARVYRSAAEWAGSFARGLLPRPSGRRSTAIHRTCRRARLTSPGPIQVDGEIRAGGEVRMEVDAAAVRILAPPDGG